METIPPGSVGAMAHCRAIHLQTGRQPHARGMPVRLWCAGLLGSPENSGGVSSNENRRAQHRSVRTMWRALE